MDAVAIHLERNPQFRVTPIEFELGPRGHRDEMMERERWQTAAQEQQTERSFWGRVRSGVDDRPMVEHLPHQWHPRMTPEDRHLLFEIGEDQQF